MRKPFSVCQQLPASSSQLLRGVLKKAQDHALKLLQAAGVNEDSRCTQDPGRHPQTGHCLSPACVGLQGSAPWCTNLWCYRGVITPEITGAISRMASQTSV